MGAEFSSNSALDLSGEGRYGGGVSTRAPIQTMVEYSDRALLPEGFHDDLPLEAEYEASVIERLLACFYGSGYDRVSPPLVEFEESLLAGSGKTLARQMFRLMDPATQRMMGIRTDITIQVARIATTRLSAAARPLRLCYAGQVLRVKGGQLRSERQFAQAGVELIGSPSVEADVEVMALAADALSTLGVVGLSADLTLPSLVTVLADELGLSKAEARNVRAALNAKDIAALHVLEGRAGTIFRGLLTASGVARDALAALDALALPPQSQKIVDDLADLVGRVEAAAPLLRLTIDPGEARGFEYKSGISFTLFAAHGRGELGRGGRYEIAIPEQKGGETATGFTLYLDSLMGVVPPSGGVKKIYVPLGNARTDIAQLQQDGWRVVRGLIAEDHATAQRMAAAQGCKHIYQNGRAEPL